MKATEKLSDIYKAMYILTRASLVFVIPAFFLHQVTKEALSFGETITPA
ncbi:hypothetical protein [Methanonatronarchaeum sp. AMET6-2]|nr:hypothetical protein [Methanonatronarchaeum sp. AMET6-2]UOY10101.1 hypothetical protein MU439_00210 [Methanonatronarchaeum sp. AMET6-2]